MTDQHEKVLREFADDLRRKDTLCRFDAFGPEAAAIEKLLAIQTRIKHWILAQHHTFQCIEHGVLMHRQSKTSECVCGLDQMRRELKGDCDD